MLLEFEYLDARRDEDGVYVPVRTHHILNTDQVVRVRMHATTERLFGDDEMGAIAGICVAVVFTDGETLYLYMSKEYARKFRDAFREGKPYINIGTVPSLTAMLVKRRHESLAVQRAQPIE